MTELEILESNVKELKEWMDAAWRNLANSSRTRFERDELRSDMKRCSTELRRCLQLIDAARASSRQSSREHVSFWFAALNFRLIGQTSRDLGVESEGMMTK